MDSAAERRRAIVSASLGTGFPALGIHISGGVVMLGGLAGGSFRRSKPIGQLKGARVEILPGKHVDEGKVVASRLVDQGNTDVPPDRSQHALTWANVRNLLGSTGILRARSAAAARQRGPGVAVISGSPTVASW